MPPSPPQPLLAFWSFPERAVWSEAPDGAGEGVTPMLLLQLGEQCGLPWRWCRHWRRWAEDYPGAVPSHLSLFINLAKEGHICRKPIASIEYHLKTDLATSVFWLTLCKKQNLKIILSSSFVLGFIWLDMELTVLVSWEMNISL